MTIQEWREFLARISYKSGWQFNICPPSRKGAKCDMEILTPEWENIEKQERTVQLRFAKEIPDEIRTEVQAMHFVYGLILFAEQHEIYEWLTLDGEQLHIVHPWHEVR